MMKMNKILARRMLTSSVIIAGITVALASPAVYGVAKAIQVADKKVATGITLYSVIALALISTLLPAVKAYTTNKKFITRAVSDFLKAEIEKDPELKSFKDVLDNTKALNNMTTVICNNLRKSERDIILKTIEDMTNKSYSSKEEALDAVLKTKETFVEIIQEHDKMHPEFMRYVFADMARAHMTYVLPLTFRER